MSAEELYYEYEHLVKLTIFKLFNNVNGIAKQHRIEPSDIFQMGKLGLWNACLKYQDTKGKFKTFAISYIKWSIVENLNRRTSIIKYDSNKLNTINKFGIVSMDAKMEDDSGDDCNTFHDLIPSDKDTENDAFGKISSDYLIKNLTKEELEIINLRNKGYSFRNIGNQWGMTGENVRVKFNKIKQKIREMEVSQQWKID